jgi:EYS protein
MRDGSYQCLCPLGKTGKFCDENIAVSDPLFKGDHSFMSLALDSAIRFNTEITLEIRVDALDGLLVHFGQSRDARHQDYFTLMLKNGSVVLSFSLGGPRGGQSHSLSLSLCCVKVGMWHKIEAGRSGRDGYLMLDSQNTMGNAPPGLTTLDVDHTLNLGGLEKFDSYYHDPENVDPHFKGCMRNMFLNGVSYPLTVERGWRGLSIDDCDGTACGGEVCQHAGVCLLEENHSGGYSCDCGEDFSGRNCEIHSLCEDNGGCQNGAVCRVEKAEVKCDCGFGFLGDFCEDGKLNIYFLNM